MLVRDFNAEPLVSVAKALRLSERHGEDPEPWVPFQDGSSEVRHRTTARDEIVENQDILGVYLFFLKSAAARMALLFAASVCMWSFSCGFFVILSPANPTAAHPAQNCVKRHSTPQGDATLSPDDNAGTKDGLGGNESKAPETSDETGDGMPHHRCSAAQGRRLLA